jgi:hypothetical protein
VRCHTVQGVSYGMLGCARKGEVIERVTEGVEAICADPIVQDVGMWAKRRRNRRTRGCISTLACGGRFVQEVGVYSKNLFCHILTSDMVSYDSAMDEHILFRAQHKTNRFILDEEIS